jgi:hypothetical protein
MNIISLSVQENGGRKSRRCLTDDMDNMDVFKVVDWACHNRLDAVLKSNEPTGQAKLRKVT